MSLPSFLQKKTGLEFEVMPDPAAAPLAELLVAFANSDGGTIVLGVTPEGRITGDLQVEDAESALQQALLLCRPPVKTTWQQFEDRDGLVVAIQVERTADLYSLADGRVIQRTNIGNEVLTGQMISKLSATRAVGDFEQEILPGATRNDLDEAVIADYMERRRQRIGRDLRMSEEELLRGIGALTADERVTVAGLVLFGRNPQFFLPQAGLTYVRYAGTDRLAAPGQARYLRREEFDGPLPHVLEDVWKELWRDLRGEAVVRGLVREDRYLLPQDAVREALVNAMCHREYRIGRRVEVSRFDDRLEITSPGGLPGWITLDNIFDEHYSRNPRLVNVLLEWKYIEQLGLGMDQMMSVMVAAGHPVPELKASPQSFTVILWQGKGKPLSSGPVDVPNNLELNERQRAALQYLTRNDRITNSILRELCPQYTGETLRIDLVELVDKGLLVKVGDKKGTYYMLKNKAGK